MVQSGSGQPSVVSFKRAFSFIIIVLSSRGCGLGLGKGLESFFLQVTSLLNMAPFVGPMLKSKE